VSGEGQEYGHALSLRLVLPCEEQVVAELVDLRRRAADLLARDGWLAEDEFFYAEQNARLVRNAEEYYREMYRARVSSWNLRDTHMAETLAALTAHLERQIGTARVVVWEHNSHVGDARATQMGASGELNVGQLARAAWGDQCALVGFTTDHGAVTAASDWGRPAERKRVRPALPGSYEHLFHQAGPERFSLPVRHAGALREPRLERAIGVVYRPQTERTSHWFHASLAQQFDAVVHFDATTAVEPLERTTLWDEGEPPETFPTGL
jgi:erythromycin esterase-like protein